MSGMKRTLFVDHEGAKSTSYVVGRVSTLGPGTLDEVEESAQQVRLFAIGSAA